MVIRSFYKILMMGANAPVGAFGGVAPVTFSIKAGGIGGTIDADGLYTAPLNKTGIDTIVATDSTPGTPLVAEYEMGVGTVLHLIADIIRREMGLAENQVTIENTRFEMQKDSRVYVAVKMLTARAFGKQTSFIDAVEGQAVNMVAPIDVAIYSRSTEAMARKEEVVMALDSIYAKQQQELNGFAIGRLGSIVPLSNIDGAAIPYFYNVSFQVQYAVKKQKAAEYFDSMELDTVITNP